MPKKPTIFDAGQFSLDPNLRATTKSVLDRDLDEEALELRKRKTFQNLGGGFIMDNEGNVTPVEGFQEYQNALRDEERRYNEQQAVLGHQRALELLQARTANQRPPGTLPPQSAAEQKAREAERLSSEAGRIAGEMPEGAVNRGKDVFIDAASNITPALGQLAGSILYDEKENMWRSDADRFDQDVSNLAAGLAVTGFELANKQKWSPRAPGISREESLNRWENIRKTFLGRAEAARGEYGQQNYGIVPGTVEEGYIYLGGPPDDPNSWEEAQ